MADQLERRGGGDKKKKPRGGFPYGPPPHPPPPSRGYSGPVNIIHTITVHTNRGDHFNGKTTVRTIKEYKLSSIHAPMIYTAVCVMLFKRAASITRASGRGLGLGNREFFRPCEMASSRLASAIWGPKNSVHKGT